MRLLLALGLVACAPTAVLPSPTPTAVSAVPSISRSPTDPGPPPTPSGQPAGYSLPSECQYVFGATTPQAWLVTCPQGLPSRYLAPSLSQQGWTACPTAQKSWRKDQLVIVITDFVNRSDATGQIEEKALATASC